MLPPAAMIQFDDWLRAMCSKYPDLEMMSDTAAVDFTVINNYRLKYDGLCPFAIDHRFVSSSLSSQ